MIKHHPKPHLEREEFIWLTVSDNSLSLRKVREETQARNVEAGADAEDREE